MEVWIQDWRGEVMEGCILKREMQSWKATTSTVICAVGCTLASMLGILALVQDEGPAAAQHSKDNSAC